jgi:hypothetical protein
LALSLPWARADIGIANSSETATAPDTRLIDRILL